MRRPRERARATPPGTMSLAMYDAWADWYRWIDPPEHHAFEAESYVRAFERGGARAGSSLLELGSGAGHNALYLKERFRCTLTDLSPAMLALSRELNPACEHLEGDLRTLRLGRSFDAVFLHDAVTYMRSEDELRAALRTAFEHTRPGGCAVVAPDEFREDFEECTTHFAYDARGRSLRGIEWSWDPDPSDDEIVTEYVFVLREGGAVKTLHERHPGGVFARETWQRLLREAGFAQVELVERAIDEETSDEVLLAVRAP